MGWVKMTMNDITLFSAIDAKIDYLDQRQKLIAQNIANADTPAYKAQDLKKADFGRMLSDVTHDNTVRIATTEAGHMPSVGDTVTPTAGKAKTVYEVAPTGNGVILEEQMVNANRTNIDYGLMLNVYKKNVGMLRTAIGGSAQ